MKCELCGKECISLGSHLSKKHRMTKEEQIVYYNKHLKKDTQEGLCPVCGKETKFINLNFGYQKFCSNKCMANSDEIKEKREETIIKKYGVKSYVETEEFKKKAEETSLKNWGVKNPNQSQEIKNKIRQSNLEKYGVPCTLQDSETQAKSIKTMQEKYGVDNAAKSKEIQDKIKATTLERYGVDNAAKSPIIQKRMRKTMLEKYGYDHNFKVPEIQEQMKQTNLEKYGYEYTGQVPEFIDKRLQTNMNRYGYKSHYQAHIKNLEDWLNIEQFLLNNNCKYSCLELSEYFNLKVGSIRSEAIRLNLQDYIKDFYTLSQPEMQFKQLLDSRLPNISYIMHDRKAIAPLELDFYFPEQKLAIEISPAYTHQYISEEADEFSIGMTDKEYHYTKFKKCEEAGIELITIFDWEDINRIIDLVEDKIQLSPNVVYARKCIVNYVDSITNSHKEFLDNYHVLGSINNRRGSFVLELIYQDNVLGIAVYCPYKDGRLELKRLAFKDRYTVVGGASKLLKNVFEYKPEVDLITTFSDNNLGTGSVYRTIGFDLIEDNKYSCTYYNPQYEWAVKETSLWLQGADRLLANFPGYEKVVIGEGLPRNDEIVMSYGFVPVYDCGYRKWIYKKK